MKVQVITTSTNLIDYTLIKQPVPLISAQFNSCVNINKYRLLSPCLRGPSLVSRTVSSLPLVHAFSVLQLTSALYLGLGPSAWARLAPLANLSDVLMLLNYVLNPILYVLMRQRRRLSLTNLCHSIAHCFKWV